VVRLDPYIAWWGGMLLLLGALACRLFSQNRPLWQEWLRIVTFLIVVLALALLLGTQARATEAAGPLSFEIVVNLSFWLLCTICRIRRLAGLRILLQPASQGVC
jgi:hypothetical protein